MTGFSVTDGLTAEVERPQAVAAGYATQSWPVKSRCRDRAVRAGLLLRTLVVLDSFEPGYGAQRDRVVVRSRVRARVDAGFALSQSRIGAASLRGDRSRSARDRWSAASDGPPRYRSGVRKSAGRRSISPVRRRQTVRPQADLQIVSATYFDTLELPIISGRAFTDDDRSVHARVYR